MESLESSLVSLSLDQVETQHTTDFSRCWQLPRLTELFVDDSTVHPAMLLRMPLLATLDWVRLNDDLSTMANMLPVLSRLQQLTSLRLTGIEEAAAAPEYAALTASSQLELLELSYCSVPPTAAPYMFPAGRCRPHLRTMSIESTCVDGHGQYFRPCGALTLREGDAGRLAGCCPGLRKLRGLVIAASAADLQPLLQLRELTLLGLEGAACDDEVAEQVLAKMTGEHMLLHIDVMDHCAGMPSTAHTCAIVWLLVH
jgi:hypothetical protein